MSYRITKTTTEIDDLLTQCTEAESEGSMYSGMTYEQGIEAALCWVLNLGRGDDHPLND